MFALFKQTCDKKRKTHLFAKLLNSMHNYRLIHEGFVLKRKKYKLFSLVVVHFLKNMQVLIKIRVI